MFRDHPQTWYQNIQKFLKNNPKLAGLIVQIIRISKVESIFFTAGTFRQFFVITPDSTKRTATKEDPALQKFKNGQKL